MVLTHVSERVDGLDVLVPVLTNIAKIGKDQFLTWNRESSVRPEKKAKAE